MYYIYKQTNDKKEENEKRAEFTAIRRINSEVYEFFKGKVMIILVLLVLHTLAGSI